MMIQRVMQTLRVLLVVSMVWSCFAGQSVFGDDKKADEKPHAVAEISDNTHAGATKDLYDPMALKGDLAAFTGVVFLLLCGGLYFAAWKPLRDGLNAREASIAKQIEDARKASEEAQAKLVEYQAKLDQAMQTAQETVAQARKDAEAAGQRILAEAQQEATRQKDRALADIESAKVAALSELGSKSTDIAFSLARSVVGRELKQADHQQLIQDSLKSLASRN
ncbi:MAG: F0F1 ATP synthase subunit B [Pirellulales bacterium]